MSLFVLTSFGAWFKLLLDVGQRDLVFILFLFVVALQVVGVDSTLVGPLSYPPLLALSADGSLQSLLLFLCIREWTEMVMFTIKDMAEID